MQKEKVRVYALARELNMESKDLLDLCRQAGLDLKNQLSSLDPDQRDMIEEMIKKGGAKSATATASAAPAPPVVPPVIHRPVRDLPPARQRPVTTAPPAAPAAKPAVAPSPPAAEPQPAAPEKTVEATPAEPVAVPAAESKPLPEIPRPQPATEAKPSAPTPPSAQPKPAAPAPPAAPARPATERPQPSAPPQVPAAAASLTPAATPKPPTGAVPPSKPPILTQDKKIKDLSGPRPEREARPRSGISPRSSGPRPPATAAAPPPLKAALTQPKEPKAPQEKTMKPLAKFTPDMLGKMREGTRVPTSEVLTPKNLAPSKPEAEDESEEAAGKKKKPGGGPGRKPGVGDREQRKIQREKRAEERRVKITPTTDLDQEEQRPRRPGSGRRDKGTRLAPRPVPVQRRQGKISMEPPITVRSLSESLGMKSVELLFKLRGMGLPTNININSTLEPAVAEEIALDSGVELEIKRPPDVEDEILADLDRPDTLEDLQPRAPIVTIMGHVDHGKTSLLDKIRRSNVASTEAGGITQVIRAWRVEHDGKPITFLDTPGHQAFTKMRARGAQVTDIAVIVVAADDGVMPQTEEAINHAKAAGVSLVVAINKVDLPNANLDKTKQQLYGLSVLPDNMGGDTPFVETSAATGKGIDELLEAISLVAELKELKANPNRPARGTCLEAMLTEGEGVVATLLVRNGTLHRGDVILCGGGYGRIRQMYSDLGQPIDEAGPSVPIRVTGLDLVPNADDPFYVVPDLSRARQVAERRRVRMQEASLAPRATLDLTKLGQQKLVELKVILKADFRGSIEAIRKELEKLKHEEVGVRILHAGIGGITESDVQLALTSPLDTMIVGFNAVPDDRAKVLAEEKGIPIREYNIIYMLTDDIRAALEGKLKPREEVIHLGRAVIRDTFKISRVGTIAGCYVTQGVIQRSAKIRVIREGVVIFPPPDRTASLESLKRFKDDASEVREGFECGLKIAGYDDVKVGDVIEAYRIEEVQRTLE